MTEDDLMEAQGLEQSQDESGQRGATSSRTMIVTHLQFKVHTDCGCRVSSDCVCEHPDDVGFAP
ncbi:hypothetical protein T4B_11564 [Trichinella pseudospiralis]|uniref:Uncharacterized protein n=1 Tax=Trichinella pseudospiralis TaxID=6337 RepID=A0A0V1HLD9_TRIPS|nr:hypothetical protein T4E_9070 [Trichinella pseudospiralis]KRZ11119.1 hypothetical protein T4B_11564 [Trichinella pseudospiralis]